MWMRQRPAAGIWAKVSMIGSPSSRSGAIVRSPSSRLPMHGGADRQQRPVAQRLGHVGDRRRAQEADDRGDLVGALAAQSR